MPAHRISMRKTREILRLRWSLGQPLRAVARSCAVAASTVLDAELRARQAGLCWPLPEDLDDAALESRLYPPPVSRAARPMPKFADIYRELRRRGVTLELLWLEYRAGVGEDGYGYSQFCDLYRRWKGQLDVTMRLEHRAGEKLFVDWAGQKMPIVNPASGEITEASIFVAALGASDFTFAEAFAEEKLPSWIAGHVHAFEFYGGVTSLIVPDNTKTAVIKVCFYDPDLNPGYREMAEYYGTAILPARAATPRDKAKVENAVLQCERWVLAPLRNCRFFSVVELNDAIRERLCWLNDRSFSKLEGTRRGLFEELDRPALRPLPALRFQSAEWKTNVGVGIDYHVEFDHHYYSVPYQLMRKRVDVRATDSVVECLHNGLRVASHLRSRLRGRHTTDTSHMPKAHQRYAEWTPQRVIRWAETIGPETGAAARHVLETKPHPEQGFRACLGIIRLAKRYSAERVENACRRARAIGSVSYKSVNSILASGLDGKPLPEPSPELELPLDHEGLRGERYYQ